MKAKLKWFQYFGIAMALFLVLSSLLPSAALADRADNGEHPASLTVTHSMGDAYEAEEFRLYLVATISDDGYLTFDEDFAEAGISPALDDDDEASIWSANAETLESYVVSRAADGNPIEPDYTGTEDEEGKIFFGNLEHGLYLLVAEQKTVGKHIYTPTATLITLPFDEDESGTNYDPEIELKHSIELLSDEPDPTPTPPTVSDNPSPSPYTPGGINLTVVKIWADDSHESERPTSVTVTLYRNEKEYSTVTLSAANSWRYTWSVPDDSSRWQLVEKDVPEHYSVTAVKSGKNFVVTNTYESETPPPSDTPSDNPTEPTTPPTSTPTPVSPVPSTTTTQTKLPQTGQLWWPIPVLAVCGLLMILVGMEIRRREEK